MRLFPVPWGLLPESQRFRKYQWVDLTVIKAASDARPESHHLTQDGVSIVSAELSTANAWQARKNIVLPLRAHCLCCLIKQRDANQFPTLGIVRPDSISKLRIAPDPAPWTEAQLSMLRQEHLFAEAPQRELEKIPFRFYYEFQCPESACNGHNVMCTDWENGSIIPVMEGSVRRSMAGEIQAQIRIRNDRQVRHPFLRRDCRKSPKPLDCDRAVLPAGSAAGESVLASTNI